PMFRLPSHPVRHWLLAILLTACVSTIALAGQDNDTAAAAKALDQKIIADAKQGSELLPNLTHLCDVIGPRLTGSPALKKANDWAADKMRSYGLTDVHLEGWTIPVGWERGTATMRIVEPDNGRSLTVAAMAWTPSTEGRVTG